MRSLPHALGTLLSKWRCLGHTVWLSINVICVYYVKLFNCSNISRTDSFCHKRFPSASCQKNVVMRKLIWRFYVKFLKKSKGSDLQINRDKEAKAFCQQQCCLPIAIENWIWNIWIKLIILAFGLLQFVHFLLSGFRFLVLPEHTHLYYIINF